jgi:large subunit ribosomal protein L28
VLTPGSIEGRPDKSGLTRGWFAYWRGHRVSFDGCLIAGERIRTYFLLERTVASVCDLCGKGPGFGNNVSHSHRRTRRRWNPNIQTVRAVVSGTPKRLNVCTSCIKAGKVSR